MPENCTRVVQKVFVIVFVFVNIKVLARAGTKLPIEGIPITASDNFRCTGRKLNATAQKIKPFLRNLKPFAQDLKPFLWRRERILFF